MGFKKISFIFLFGLTVFLVQGCYRYSYYDAPAYSYGEASTVPFSQSLPYDDGYYNPPPPYYGYPYYGYPYHPYYPFYPYYAYPPYTYYPYPFYFRGHFHYYSSSGTVSPSPRRTFKSGSSSGSSSTTAPAKKPGRVFK